MVLLRSAAHAVAAFTLLSPVLASAQNSSSSLPTVDLGYELYQATAFNETRGYYNFSNIRYAAPPVANLRFKAPAPPVTDRSVINDGSVGRICPQASTSSNSSDPRETEDCLFLDVIVQQKVFSSVGKGNEAPVLVWIHGGGYTSGSKAAERTPSGLIQRSISNSSDGIIFVGINYRLGGLGWLSGPTLQENGTANAGLHDQRFALQWVQDNIHLFGGDKDRVTVIGESAGGGSIIHQLTAYGGSAKPPFAQAIAQSPAWFPQPSLYSQEQRYQSFLTAANVSSLEEARKLSSEQAIAANTQLVASSALGFGPAVDGDIVTQDAKSLLNHGQFDKSIKVLVGHNANEGVTLAPTVTDDATVDAYVAAYLSSAPAAILEYVTGTLYPHVSNGTSGAGALYNTPTERLAFILSEAAIVCNAFALSTAFPRNATHAYYFGVAPAVHGQDVPNTFYDPGAALSSGDGGFAATLPFNQTVAFVLQDYITSFALTGAPKSALDGLPAGFVEYGAGANVVSLTAGGISVRTDPGANERCKWWELNLIS